MRLNVDDYLLVRYGDPRKTSFFLVTNRSAADDNVVFGIYMSTDRVINVNAAISIYAIERSDIFVSKITNKKLITKLQLRGLV